MKNASIQSIKDNNPVWFGCDVGKYFSRNLGVMDDKLFDFELFYGTGFNLTKKQRLEYGESQMTHAMLFTGVDLDNNENLLSGELKIVGEQQMAIKGII